MAEFQKVMREWVRARKAINENMLSSFPLEMFTDDNIANIEKEVMSWAAEHPEPVYPTWIDWLMSEGVIPTNYMAANSTDSGVRAGTFYVTIKAFKPIPAGIAEKLGITPKENN